MTAKRSFLTTVRARIKPAYVSYAIALLLLILVLGLNGSKLSVFEITSWSNAVLPLALVGIGQTFVILTNGIDLSLGAIVSLADVVVASGTISSHVTSLGAVVIAILFGVLCGAINGFLVAYGQLTPIVVTLASGSIFSGIAIWIMPSPGGQVSTLLSTLATGDFGFLPLALLWLILLLFMGWVILRRNRWGIGIQAVGGSASAAWANGLKIKWYKMTAYMAGGLFASLSGVALAGLTTSGDPNVGVSYTLNSVAAVVLGGTQLVGGKGTFSGSISGAVILSLIGTFLYMANLSSYLQYIVTGGIIVVSLGAATMRRVRLT